MNKRLLLMLLLGCLAILPITNNTSAQSSDPWSRLIPRTSFGYGALRNVYWSPLNGQLAVTSEHGIQFFNENLVIEAERRFDYPFNGFIRFSPDMRYVALEENGILVVRDTATWQPLLALQQYAAPSWSHDSRYFALWTGSRLRVWDVQAGEATLETNELISDNAPVQWSPDSQVVAVAGDGAILMIGAATGDIVRIHPFDAVQRFDWSLDGRYFVVLGRKEPIPLDRESEIPILNQLMLVDVITGEIVHTYDPNSGGRAGSVYGVENFVSISPNGRFVAASLTRWEPAIDLEGTENGTPSRYVSPGMGLWDLETGTPVHNFGDDTRALAQISNVTWSPDGSYFATTAGSAIAILEAASGQYVDTLQAYIPSTSNIQWQTGGRDILVDNGRWSLEGELPTYEEYVPPPPRPEPLDLSFIEPSPFNWDFEYPPYRWEIIEVYEDRGLLITYEEDIEYPGTPEYEDEIPPDERWIIWNIATQERWEEYSNLGKQTAWLYDLDNADERANGNTYFNVQRTTRFVVVGDDEIVDLRTEEKIDLDVLRWEYRDVWFGPNGDRVLAYDTDSRFKAFDPLTGELLYATGAVVRDMRFTPDNSLFTVRDSAGILYIYDYQTGELLLEASVGTPNYSIAWSDDLTHLALYGDNRAIVVYKLATRERLAILRGHQSSVRYVTWQPDCDLQAIETCNYVLASTDVDGRFLLWGVADAVDPALDVPETPSPPTLDLPRAEINFADLEPLWTYVGDSTSFGREAPQRVLWSEDVIRVNNGYYYDTALQLLEDPPSVNWSRPIEVVAGRQLFSDGSVITQDGEHVQVGRAAVSDAAFLPDGSQVLTAEAYGSRQVLGGRIRVWSTISGIQVNYFGGGAPGYNQIAVSPDGQWLATATIDYYGSGGRGQIWSMGDYVLHHSLIGHTADIIDLRWHPDNSTIITASLDGSVRIWRRDGEEFARWRHPLNAPIHSMTWGPTNSTLVVSAGYDIYVLSSLTLQEIKRFENIGGRGFDWSPDKTKLVAIGPDSVIRVIDFNTGDVLSEERRHMPSITVLEWNPQGDQLAVGRRDGSLVLLDGVSGEVNAILRAAGPAIRSVAWNPDGTRLLLDLENAPIQIVSARTGATDVEIENPWRRIGAWWSPDGTMVAFGTYPDPNMGVYTATSLVWVHDADTGEPIHQLYLDWDDYIWYWNVKPFALRWSDDSTYLAVFYAGRLRYWHLTEGDTPQATFTDIGTRLGLTVWRDDQLYFWMTNGHGVVDLRAATMTYDPRDGLPADTLMRPDGRVLLSGGLILDFETLYPLQGVPQAFTSASWHPSCWTAECPAVLAVSNGNNVTMFGFQEGE